MILEEDGYGLRTYFPEPPLVVPAGSFEGNAQELAKLILQQIRSAPENFDMGSWIDGANSVSAGRSSSTSPSDFFKQIEQIDGTTICGTTMCVAGYAQLFTEGRITREVERVAAKHLGFLENAYHYLFYTTNPRATKILEYIAEHGPDQEGLNNLILDLIDEDTDYSDD